MPPVSVVQLPELLVVALKVEGTVAELRERVPATWTQLLARLPGVCRRLEPDVFYGVAPQGEEPPDDRFTRWVGVAVEAFEDVPPDLVMLRVPAGAYAALRVEGGEAAVSDAAMAFFRWQQAGHHALGVFRRGYDGSEAYALERYHPRRQRAMPPAAPFDYDVLKPLA